MTGAVAAGTCGPDIARKGRGSWFVATHERYRDAPRQIVDDLAGVGLRFETGTQVDEGLLVPGRRCAWR
jgi:hypothetical protein